MYHISYTVALGNPLDTEKHGRSQTTAVKTFYFLFLFIYFFFIRINQHKSLNLQ
jgi:hypothetical protein